MTLKKICFYTILFLYVALSVWVTTEDTRPLFDNVSGGVL